jgi:hypothetical protein
LKHTINIYIEIETKDRMEKHIIETYNKHIERNRKIKIDSIKIQLKHTINIESRNTIETYNNNIDINRKYNRSNTIETYNNI